MQEFGAKKMAGKDPPSKRSLFSVNKRPELVERRKKELQLWLWRLVGDAELAKSAALNSFLELGDAARVVQRSVSGLTLHAVIDGKMEFDTCFMWHQGWGRMAFSLSPLSLQFSDEKQHCASFTFGALELSCVSKCWRLRVSDSAAVTHAVS